MARITRFVWISALSLGLLGGLAYYHLWLGRPDRVREADRQLKLDLVRDQIMRFETEHGRLPETLAELVPAYLRQDELAQENGAPCYRYDSKERFIEEREGAVIHGLFATRRAPSRHVFPPQQLLLKPLATQRPVPVKAPVGAQVPVPETPKTPSTVPSPARPAEPASVRLALVEPHDAELAPPPPGCLVFEAEHYSETNYGWEIHPDPSAAGGLYLHTKEGIANGSGQLRHETGDFYALHDNRKITYLRYQLHLPASGTWYVYGRMWTTDTHCSNSVTASFDQPFGPYGDSLGNETPFRWVWSEMRGGPYSLKAGDHYLHIFIHEDGLRIDQFILSPKALSGDTPYRANLETGAGTAWLQKQNQPVQLSFDLKSMVITPTLPPECNLMLRRLGPAKGTAKLRVALDQAAADGKGLVLAEGTVDLASLPEVSWLPLNFQALALARLPRREYRLHAELSALPQDQAAATPLASAEVPLLKPFAWEVFGPGKYLSDGQAGPLDGDGQPKPGDTRIWTPFRDDSFDWFGVLDFGLQLAHNSLHAPQYQTVYARTRVKVPAKGVYFFKFQNDDQMIVWWDGKEIYREEDHLPVTRSPGRFRLQLEAGEHRLRLRVNQTEARWQACVRIRSENDECGGVEGLETQP